MKNEIVIYQSPDGLMQLDVQLDNQTVWLTQAQMALLFEQTKQNISLHISNCFKEGELEKIATVKESLTVQQEGKRVVERKLEYYNLDVIISVGYRVKSQRGTQFRIWATQRLKDYLVQGYVINQKRLDELQKVVQIISQGGDSDELKVHEAKGMLDIITNYTQSFILLNQYDSQRLETHNLNENITYEIEYEEAFEAIKELKKQLIAAKEARTIWQSKR